MKRLRIDIDVFNEPSIKKNRFLNDIPILDKENIIVNYNKLISYGGYGILYEGYINNVKIAVKIMKKSIGSHHYDSLMKIYNSSYDNILKPLFISNCKKCIVYPKIEGSSISHEKFVNMDEKKRMKMIQEMIYAVDNLHLLRIIHSDIKPDNFMIDEKNKIILVDIDNCIPVIQNEPIIHCLYPQYGTMGYRRPLREKISFDDDYWSLGATIYNLYLNEIPFENKIENFKNLSELEKIIQLEEMYYQEDAKIDLCYFKKTKIHRIMTNLFLQ